MPAAAVNRSPRDAACALPPGAPSPAVALAPPDGSGRRLPPAPPGTPDADDRELLAALLGPAASDRVAGVPVADLLDAEEERLVALGLPPAARRRLLAGAELARRFQPGVRPAEPLRQPRDVLPLLAPLRAARSELLVVLALDARLGALGEPVRVAEGAVAHVSVEVREVFAPALERRASAIVLAHNHPSGVCDPTPEDRGFTRQMRRAGGLLGVPLLDHLVVARRAYFSFAEAGLLERRP